MSRKKLISIIIRTFNEARYLDQLLIEIEKQQVSEYNIEVILVDSGSTDETLTIAEKHNALITHINQSEFTFGRSLNMGCALAQGDFLVFISGHCIPVSDSWLEKLVSPLNKQLSHYSYGRQIGKDSTKFSESRLFEKYFPPTSSIPQAGSFCNNANAAITHSIWKKHHFDETLTGLEDMYLAQKICSDNGSIAYVAEAGVYHIHDETWRQVRIRYEREAIALQKIMPELHFGAFDLMKCIFSGVIGDFRSAATKKILCQQFSSIVLFRFMQFYGVYKGNHQHRKLSQASKMRYYYPAISNIEITHEKKNHCANAPQGK